MKRFAIAMGLLAAITSCPLLAQTITLKGNVPFDFHMGTVNMPAGEYTIHQSGALVTVRNAEGRNISAMYLTLPKTAPAGRNYGALVFNRYGNDYFLTQIWVPNSTEGRVLPVSTREKELISRAGAVQTASTTLERK
jgi:hypothetical protein